MSRHLPEVLLVVLASLPARAQLAEDTGPQRFVESLNRLLLSTAGGPAYSADSESWRYVVLAAPGTPLSSTLTPFDALGHDTLSVGRLLEANSAFDGILSLHAGFAQPTGRSLEAVWGAFLAMARPVGRPEAPAEGTDQSELLFRKADEIDRLRGVAFHREPSEAYRRYREFQLLFRMLVGPESGRQGLWRLHPRLSNYSSADEARKAVGEDWIRFGYKIEVEAALEALERSAHVSEWLAWSEAAEAYRTEAVDISATRRLPITLLFPPPEEWFGMGSWLRVAVRPESPTDGIAEFQLARIRLVRPWLVLDYLKKWRSSQGQALTLPPEPWASELPDGSVAFAEELILVRGISLRRSASVPPETETHPLGLFAYPDATNLLGYVLRVLPAFTERSQ